MTQYISLAATAWFMGFFPLSDIHIAIPSTMALGLETSSAVMWSGFGSFISIPIISYFYEQLSRIKKINKYFQKLSSSKFSSKMKENGFLFVLIATPLLGSWAIAVLGKAINMDKRKLFVASALSIALTGILIGILINFGLTAIF